MIERVAGATGVLAIVAASGFETAAGASWFAIAGVVLGAIALYRAGSVRAWRETAEARAERLEDVERELAELRAELAIPERLEGIVRLMAETAERQDAAAVQRLESAMKRLDARWEAHNAATETQAARLETAIRDLCAAV
jgi:hypothetical protein